MATPAPSEPTVDLMYLLNEASHALSTELAAGLAGLGITPRGHCVLVKARRGDMTQKQIAEASGLDKTTMVVTVDQLEADGLAERRQSVTDRRARLVAATPAGERVAGEADAIVAGIYRDVLGSLPAAEAEAFVAALVRLVGEGGRLSSPAECDRPVRRPRMSPVAG
jgi:MarR family transcriptional regulator, transcriptional regulator for hemolysin